VQSNLGGIHINRNTPGDCDNLAGVALFYDCFSRAFDVNLAYQLRLNY